MKAYAVFAYLAFLGVFVVLADFVAGPGAIASIDRGATSPAAIPVDVALIAAFGVVHSVMARPWFKRRWVPAAAERSTYVLVASAQLALIVWQWRPIADVVWTAPALPMRVIYGLGVVLIAVATFQTNHWDFIGLRQAWLGARYTPVPFVERGLYRYVRHPMMVAIVIWLWATPVMTLGHLVFALAMTGYVVVGVVFEERALVRTLGEPYLAYRRRVRAFVPIRR